MRVPVTDSNIQEKDKTCVKKPAAKKRVTQPKPELLDESQIVFLTMLLRWPGPTGELIRTLVRLLRHPERPYTSRELEILLWLTIALTRAGMWP